jgi:hypothetical protein
MHKPQIRLGALTDSDRGPGTENSPAAPQTRSRAYSVRLAALKIVKPRACALRSTTFSKR